MGKLTLLLPTLQAGNRNAQRRAVESIEPGEVLVIECRNSPEAGTIGDILSMRALSRGASGIAARSRSLRIAGHPWPAGPSGSHAAPSNTMRA